MILAGDFNKLDFAHTARTFQLKPSVSFPTRGNNTLDQIFTNLLEYYQPATSAPPFGLSDHLTIGLRPRIRSNQKTHRKFIKTRDKRPSKIASLGRFLSEIPWSDLLSTVQSCDDKLTILTDIITYGLNTIMPQQSMKVHITDRPWITNQLKSLIARRQKAFNSGNTLMFKLFRNKVNRERKRCRKIYYQKKVQDLHDTKPRDWWREVKQLCGNSNVPRCDLRTILNPDLNYEEKDLSNEISKAFISVMQSYNPLSEDVCVSMEDDVPISTSELVVAAKLKEISTSRAGGPDGLPNWVLKEFAEILATPITDILNTSFRDCKVPRIWKIADVCPLPKVSTICDFTKDLRPISLTSTLSKLAEGIIIDKELKHTVLKSIDSRQYGFIPGSSTTFALISMLHEWLSSTDKSNSAVGIVLLDYKKAFDLVDHTLLIAKLFSLGTKPSIVNWIIDFLRDRTQRVKLNSDCFSDWTKVPAGVAQGTKLGPWLFLVMINDLTTLQLSSSMWKFADDTTISNVFSNPDACSLQECVQHVAEWSKTNLFQLNPTKCKEMVICFKKHFPALDPVEVNGQSLERVSTAKILGVTFRNDLKWNDHVDLITSKAAKRLYLLRQLKRADVNAKDLIGFYCSCIRSVLEYACQVFHCSLTKYLCDEIERIQKRAMHIIYPDLSYADAIVKVDLPSLVNRRDSLCSKLFDSIVNNNSHKLMNLLPPKANSYSSRLRKKRCFQLPNL